MTLPLKILIVEDNAADAEMIKHILKKENLQCEFRLVMTKETYLAALDEYHPDIILSDNSLPQFDATEALQINCRRSLKIPFILVTGTVSEEFAANIIKSGADDYILKDRLARLPSAIAAALKQRTHEKEKQEIIEQLKDNENKYRTLVERVSDGFMALDQTWSLVYVNKKAEELLNKPHGYLPGKNMWQEFPEAIHKAIYDAYHRAMQTQEHFCLKEYSFAIGRWLETNIYPSPTGLSVYFKDVTVQSEARQKIELAEERARVAIEAANIGTFDLDLVTGAVTTSHRYNEIFGFNQSRTRVEYAALLHPEDAEIRKKAHDLSYTTGKLFYEARIIRKDKTLRWIRAEGILRKNEQGVAARLIGYVMDITEAKYLLKQKDDFIGIASHELKTPVTTIKAYTHILQEMLTKRGDIPEIPLIINVEKQVARLSGLIGNLLDTTKMISGHLQFNQANFKSDLMVAEVVRDLQLTTDKKIILKLSAGDCCVYADKDKIEQTISNLVNNAIKFSPHDDTIIVATSVCNNEIKFGVTDFGIGIKEENKEKIFQKFYRVNDDFKYTFPGLGLGLYISSEIIKREGGKIWVESTEGKGSAFYFTLPCVAADN